MYLCSGFSRTSRKLGKGIKTQMNTTETRYEEAHSKRIATIGFFDGVHVGHQYVFAKLREEATKRGLQPTIVTFRQHPREVLENGYNPLLLTTLEEREELLRNQLGSDTNKAGQNLIVLNFDELYNLSAGQFMHLLHEQYDVEAIVMGYDHRFGCDRLCDRQDYVEAGKQVGMEIITLGQYRPQVSFAEDGLPQHVSSTEIRILLQEGKIEEANELLGYDYPITGNVVHGNNIGKQIGFPTANLSVAAEKLIPLSGVYTAEVNGIDEDKKHYAAVVNIGNNPTIGNTHQTIEVHIPTLTPGTDLYGKNIQLALSKRLRDEQRFDTLEELQAQIRKDIEAIG